MNWDIVGTEIEPEDILLSITTVCETFIDQTHTKPHDRPEYKFAQVGESFSFEPSFDLGLDSNWTIGLTSFVFYHFISNKTPGKIKFELYTAFFVEFFSQN